MAYDPALAQSVAPALAARGCTVVQKRIFGDVVRVRDVSGRVTRGCVDVDGDVARGPAALGAWNDEALAALAAA